MLEGEATLNFEELVSETPGFQILILLGGVEARSPNEIRFLSMDPLWPTEPLLSEVAPFVAVDTPLGFISFSLLCVNDAEAGEVEANFGIGFEGRFLGYNGLKVEDGELDVMVLVGKLKLVEYPDADVA